jgi:hypothetical protein
MLFTGGNTSKAWCVDATQCVSALAPLASPTFTGNTTVASFTNTPTSVSTQAFNGALGNIFTRVLSASETFTQSGFTTGQTFIVKVQQASGQSYTVTWWAGVTWITYGATAPIQTKTSLGYTTYGFVTTGTNTFDGYLISSQ